MIRRGLCLLFLLTGCLGGGDVNNESGPPESELIQSDTPVITSTSPVSPAIEYNPSVIGTSESEAEIKIYSDSACTSLAATDNADSSGNFSIAVSLLGDSTTTFYATATAANKSVSACSTTNISFRNNAITPGTAWLSGTETNAPSTPTKVNQATDYAINWSSSEFDTTYFSHSTSLNPERITVQTGGDYLVAATLPLIMTSGTYRPCVRLEVRVNGVLVSYGVGESSYIRFDQQEESSSHSHILLRNLTVSDFIEIYVQETAGQDGTELVNISGQASLYLEYVGASRNVFNATATRTVSSTNINQAAASSLEWTESRKDNAFIHSDATNPENIQLDQSGSYLVFVNIPIYSTTLRVSPMLLVQINGVTVNGGRASQGYLRVDSSHTNSSLHWSGVIHNVTPGDILSLKTQQDNLAGTVTVSAGTTASLSIEYLGNTSTNMISLRANALSGGTNWNPAAAQNILWATSDLHDTTIYNHSTVLNLDQITVLENGDYLLIYNDSLTSPSGQRTNPKIRVKVNGTPISGAETKTHYARNTSGHQNTSAALTFLLRNLSANDIITISSEEEGIAGTVNDLEDALLSIIKK